MIKEEINKFNKYHERIKALNYALFVMSFDSNTDCPIEGRDYSYQTQNFFNEEMITLQTSKEYLCNLEYLHNNLDQLDELIRLEVIQEYKDVSKLKKIPQDDLFAFHKLQSESQIMWEKARETNDYQLFEENLEKMIAFDKRYIDYMQKPYKHPYDIAIDDMEEGFDVQKYDEFFSLIKKEIVPLVKQVISTKPYFNEEILKEKWDIEGQRKITKYIAALLDYSKEKGCIRETIHPFSHGVHNKDCRITTAYDENDFTSNLYSVMHEIGHAIYNLGHDDKYSNTVLFGGASCAMHESQSRFYENYLGRSKEFIELIYAKLKKIYPTIIIKYSVDDLYHFVNYAYPQYYRIMADELTYPIHVLIRYEVEKAIFEEKIHACDMSEYFDSLLEEYLGIKPTNKTEGVFQDVHWAGGSFGYFPTYAIGSAMSAQFYYAMKKDINIEELVKKGDFKPITSWLNKNVHQYGHAKTANEILLLATNEEFNPNYYIKYLKEKFTSLYRLEK